jgi:AcrR family transcriptional regulator
MTASRLNATEAILDAAENIALESGALHLTLDAAAERAGVSKGGLLYHFPTKEALIEAMIHRMHERFDKDLEKAREKFRNDPSAELKAFVHAFQTEDARMKRLCASLLAAAANNPKLLGPAREFNAKCFRELKLNGISFARAMVIVLAAHGFWMLDVLEVAPFNPAEVQSIFQEMLDLAEPSPAV